MCFYGHKEKDKIVIKMTMLEMLLNLGTVIAIADIKKLNNKMSWLGSPTAA